MAYRGFSGMGSSSSGSSSGSGGSGRRGNTPQRKNPVKVIIIDGDNKKNGLIREFPEKSRIGGVLANYGILKEKQSRYGVDNNFNDYYTTINIEGKIIELGEAGSENSLSSTRFYSLSKQGMLEDKERKRKLNQRFEETKERLRERQGGNIDIESTVEEDNKETQEAQEAQEAQVEKAEEGTNGYYDEFGNLDITITLTKKQKKKRGFFGLWGGSAKGGSANCKRRTRKVRGSRRRKARKTSKC